MKTAPLQPSKEEPMTATEAWMIEKDKIRATKEEPESKEEVNESVEDNWELELWGKRHDFTDEPDKFDELLNFIRSEKKKSFEEGYDQWFMSAQELKNGIIKESLDKRNKEISDVIRNIAWDGRLSQGQMIDNILDFINK